MDQASEVDFHTELSADDYDIDTSIKNELQVALTRLEATGVFEYVSGGPKMETSLPEPPALKHLEHLKTKEQQLSDRIEELEDEVEGLQLEAQRAGSVPKPSARGMMELLKGYAATTTSKSGEETKQRQPRQESMKEKLRLQETLDGIEFKTVNCSVAHRDCGLVHYQMTHVGSCYGRDVTVTFTVQSNEGDSQGPLSCLHTARIGDLKVFVDSSAENDLQNFIQRVTAKNGLMKFYRTYIAYCYQNKQRLDAFLIAQSLYQEHVMFPDDITGTRLHFDISDGFQLLFNWNISVSEEGKVRCSLGLQTKPPRNASDQDYAVIASMQELLRKMEGLYGPSKTLLDILAVFKL
ncbi:hypothetical protein EMCRGX_G020626 [Ephydatia muelleri]